MTEAKHWTRAMVRSLAAAAMALSLVLMNFSTWPVTVEAAGTTYYVDSAGGDDGNSGTTESSAWQSLNAVNSKTFAPGDRILFKAGGMWTGQLHPLGSGESGSPIVIDMYGTGSRPLLNGNGLVGAVLYLYNQQYWEINDLEVTNTSATPDNRQGVNIVGENAGALNHIYIRGLYVHDVTGKNTDATKGSGGIFVGVNGTAVPTYWNDVLIDGNTVKAVDRTGIATGSSWGDNALSNFAPFTNVVISNNTLSDIGGDGIILRSASDGLIQYNVVNKAHVRDANYDVAIWTINSNNTVMQYNEAYNTQTVKDGQGFDCDYKNNGCTVQYNYSHDNVGGFLLVMGNYFNNNVTVRYNISQNDGNSVFTIGNNGSVPNNLNIYNNTIYLSSSKSTVITKNGTSSNGSNPMYFKNNIIYNLGTGGYAPFGGLDNWDSNLFYGNHPASEPADPHKLTSDPLLDGPGTGGIGLHTVDGYKLRAESPALASGAPIGSNGGKDYWGNPVSDTAAPNRGVYNGLGLSPGDSGQVPVHPPADSSLSFTPSADAYVRDGSYANTNFGTDTVLNVKSDAAGYARKSYLKFDFNSYSGSNVLAAKLRLNVSSVGTDPVRTIKLYGVTLNTWTEKGITWNNAPENGTLIDSFNIGTTAGGWYEFDVTGYINSNMAGKLVSFELANEGAPSSGGFIIFNSNEAANGKPELVLQLTPADVTPPVTANDAKPGWSNVPQTVTLTAADDLSGVARTLYSVDHAPFTVGSSVYLCTEGIHTIRYYSVDKAGNPEAPKTFSLNLDSTEPAIAVSVPGDGDMYEDSGDLTPLFTVTDSLSGADNSKTTVTLDTYSFQIGTSIPFYMLPLGQHTFVVKYSDMAGNQGSKAVYFQTAVSVDALKTMVWRFTGDNWIANAGIANSLQAKLKSGNLNGFINEILAQDGKHISSEAANYLLRDARFLLSRVTVSERD